VGRPVRLLILGCLDIKLLFVWVSSTCLLPPPVSEIRKGSEVSLMGFEEVCWVGRRDRDECVPGREVSVFSRRLTGKLVLSSHSHSHSHLKPEVSRIITSAIGIIHIIH
jgi:hypothetical protein